MNRRICFQLSVVIVGIVAIMLVLSSIAGGHGWGFAIASLVAALAGTALLLGIREVLFL